MNLARNRLLVLGATSDIGRATARSFASRGWTIGLAGRDFSLLEREAADITSRYDVSVSCHQFDVLETDSFVNFVDSLSDLPDVVVSVIGLLGDQTRAQSEVDHATIIMRSNYEGPALILGVFASRFLSRGSGTIVGVSSVAGERGRASNYVYGSAKAGLTAFLSGLRNRLARHGVHVICVKPGFVRTRMTVGLRLPALLTTEPMVVGAIILRAVERGSDVIYVTGIWRLLMAIIRAIPESVFKRMTIG